MLYFLFNIKRQGMSLASSNEYLSKIKHLSKDTRRLLISRVGIGWKLKLTMRLNDHEYEYMYEYKYEYNQIR